MRIRTLSMVLIRCKDDEISLNLLLVLIDKVGN